MRSTATSLTLAISLAAMLAACGSQPPAPEQSPAGVTDGRPAGVGGPGTGGTTAPVATDGIDPYSLAALKDPKSAVFKRSVFFDYDQYVIKDEFKPLVDAHAQFLIKNPKLKMLIQGNADERGSREYNLALGQKRADAVRKALTLLGAKDDQIESVSLGEEKPRCTDQTEACWAQNRRGDMLYSGEF
jgi:peptidoglycan-associated lipoprotein